MNDYECNFIFIHNHKSNPPIVHEVAGVIDPNGNVQIPNVCLGASTPANGTASGDVHEEYVLISFDIPCSCPFKSRVQSPPIFEVCIGLHVLWCFVCSDWSNMIKRQFVGDVQSSTHMLWAMTHICFTCMRKYGWTHFFLRHQDSSFIHLMVNRCQKPINPVPAINILWWCPNPTWGILDRQTTFCNVHNMPFGLYAFAVQEVSLVPGA